MGNRAGIYKMLVRIANRDDTNQTASLSDMGLHCLFTNRYFLQATIVQNFRMQVFTIH